MTTTLTRNVNTKIFCKNIRSLLSPLSGTDRGETQQWFDHDNKRLIKFFKLSKTEQSICTIENEFTPKKLINFFYIPQIRDRDNLKTIPTQSLIKNTADKGVLILGRLGQGKSMLLRYLHFLELNSGKSIPLFIELKSIENGDMLQDYCRNKLINMGLECSQKLFTTLLSKGFIKLFLDGYDEIHFAKRNDFNSNISQILNNKFNNIIITSRYDTEIQKLSLFNEYEILALKEDDHVPFINKTIDDENLRKSTIKNMQDSKDFDFSVLDTPLLITWFVMVYRNCRNIPNSKITFYEELFKTLLSRHDKVKDILDRPSKSMLSDTQIENILNAVCYLMRQEDEIILKESQIINKITQAFNIEGISNVEPEDYLYDLLSVTCILNNSGMKYSFIHDSIQSYFSARFIKKTTETNSSSFYAKADLNWKNWIDELGFLYYIDSYKFHRFLMLPSIAELSNTELDLLIKNKQISNIKTSKIKQIFSDASIQIYWDKAEENIYISSFYNPTASYTSHFIFDGGNLEPSETDKFICDYIKKRYTSSERFNLLFLEFIKSNTEQNDSKMLRAKIELMDLLKGTSSVDDFCSNVKDIIVNKINITLKSSFKVIKKEELKGKLF